LIVKYNIFHEINDYASVDVIKQVFEWWNSKASGFLLLLSPVCVWRGNVTNGRADRHRLYLQWLWKLEKKRWKKDTAFDNI